jgi:hypothetical protein
MWLVLSRANDDSGAALEVFYFLGVDQCELDPWRLIEDPPRRFGLGLPVAPTAVGLRLTILGAVYSFVETESKAGPEGD